MIVATALMNGDVASLDDSMVRRVIKKPFDINAVANALIEIAREAAEKRAATPQEPPKIIVAKDVEVTANEVILPTAEEVDSEKKKAEELPKPDKIE